MNILFFSYPSPLILASTDDSMSNCYYCGICLMIISVSVILYTFVRIVLLGKAVLSLLFYLVNRTKSMWYIQTWISISVCVYIFKNYFMIKTSIPVECHRVHFSFTPVLICNSFLLTVKILAFIIPQYTYLLHPKVYISSFRIVDSYPYEELQYSI